MTERATDGWGVSERAARLHRCALVWDDHGGFAYHQADDLEELERWAGAGCDYLSINAGYDVQPYRVDLHGKLSFPFVCLIVPLVAIPFSAAPGRRSSMAAALALSVGVAVAYFFVHSLIVSVGRAGGLEPVIAAWLTNVLFALVGGYRLLGLPQ